MSFTLRRSQSLKSLAGAHSSWSTPEASQWERRTSVSRLVQKYESCAELTDVGREDAWSKSFENRSSTHEERNFERIWRKYESLSGGKPTLSRSISMDMLPRANSLVSQPLRTLVVSKTTMQQNYASSPQLNIPPHAKSSPVSNITSPRPDSQTGREKFYSSTTTVTRTKKDQTHQKDKSFEMMKSKTFTETSGSSSGLNHEKKDLKPSPSSQEQKQRFTLSPIPSVKDRSALYLSKVKAVDNLQPQGSVIQRQSTLGQKKESKMAEVAKQIKEKDSASGDEDFPPPPPLPRPQVLESIQANQHINFLPVPPPKETFSEIYQQRQKNELKRLFKHIHPDLRKNLDHVVDGELIETINPQAGDTSSQGEVQSMRWIFENWTLDNIGDPHETKKLLDEENLGGGNVRGKSSLFEQSVFDSSCTTSTEKPGFTKGDVRIATCLFETQPLDSISRLQRDGEAIVEVVLKEPVQKGDVKGARLLFESKPINGLGHCCSVEDKHFLNLQSEIQESKGDVKKTIKLFQADPLCALRDSNGHIHKIKSICREEIQTGSFESARWLFETQPLDFINKETNGMQIIQGISLEEDHKGSFAQKKWMFETLPLDAIYENASEEQQFQGVEHQTLRTEVKRELKKEAVVGGNVESTLWLFETQAIDTLKDGCDVGQLQKVTRLKEDSVQDNKQLGKTTSESGRKVEDDERGNVKTFKSIFEALPLGQFSQVNVHNADMEVCEISAGNNSALETKPLYALKDCAGNLHGITMVSREENIKGNVQKYKWMFETKPLDQFENTSEKVEVIQGITRQEDTVSDERTAKWMFETQPLDETEDASVKPGELQAGNVKQFKWRFETQPLQINFEKSEKIEESVPRNSVKSQTWLFETQTLDKVNEEEFQLKLCKMENLKSDMNVKTVKHLFETEPLDKITNQTDTVQTVRCVSQVDVKSGDVSRVKDFFESKSFQKTESDLSTTEDRTDQIQPGSVNKCTWLFENQPIGEINAKDEKMTHSIRDVQGGDVGSMKFIFETSSMDKMQDKEQLDEEILAITSGNVKASTMRFESQPLYAIKDKEGQFYVVNTVQKEEVRRGDVKGARWMFETNPIDTIHADNEIYVIRAVTQEDVLKGDVKSARWKFETQPLDSFTTCEPLPVNSEIEGRSKVQQSKVLFETTQTSQKYVRTVSVTDVQQGNVRTSTWLFESQPIDALRGESDEENNLKTVHREDNIKGDVKHCTWLFESQPLDQIKTSDDTNQSISSKEQVPKADVKSTTWLFETTPLDKITVESVTDVLHHLAQQSFIHSNGIIIQANDYKYVNMAKYQFVPYEGPVVQKEEIVEGNIRNIMMQLLFKPNIKPKVLILKDDEQGEIHSTLLDFPFQQPGSAPKPDAECKTQESVTIIDSLLAQQKTIKSGLVMQESEGGQPEMTVYSLQCQKSTSEQQVARGDVKSTIGSLLATVHGQQAKPSCTLDQTERGNVNLYRDCIEKGELSHLQRLKNESDEESAASSKDLIEIVQGDVKEAKRHLNTQREEIERTIIDIVPGDVKNAKKVFSRRPSDPVLGNFVPREEIIRGDVSSAKQQLDEAAKQSITVQKEEIVFGDIKSTLESLERAKQQSMHIEREVIKPGTIYDLNIEVQESDESENKFIKEEIISGDIKAAKRSLEKAKNQSIRVEKKSVTPGRLCDLDESSQYPVVTMVEQSTTSVLSNQRITTTFQKVSDIEKDYESARCCHPNKEGGRNVINVSAENVTTELDSNPELLNVEAERVRGDVKAAIQSLQHAVSEQRNVDREEIVKGNMKETLQSLEKSSINISKGDYKAAMLYRKAGQSHTQSKMKSDKQLVEHLFSSDTELSSSVSVTGNKCLSIISSDSSKLPSSAKGKQAQLIPQKPGQVNNQKPVMSPKLVFITDMPEDDPGTNHISTPVTRLKDNPTVSTHQSEQQKSKPVDSSATNQSVQKTDYSLTDPEHFQRRQYTEEWIQNLQMDSTENVPFPKTNDANNAKDVPFTENEEHIETQKKNDAKKISTSPQTYWKDNTETEVEHTVSPQKTLCLETTCFPKEPKAVTYKTLQEHYEDSNTSENVTLLPEKHKKPSEYNTNFKEHNGLENKVVLREKKARRETEDECRQRLSVHKEEIMSGNVKAAMEIFEKLAKREELKIILSKVEEIEGESWEVDVKSQNVPSLDHAALKNKPQRHVALSTVGTGTENPPEDADSVSSVDAAFEDLEKASADILKLKEQTLAKLQDIEVAIKKALYSVSNLKSEADIAGLSGLFSESLTAENISPGTNKIRKISIVSSKSKPKTLESHEHTSLPTNAATLHPVPTFHSCVNLPSSPSFISIHSAARKSAESSTHQQSRANDQLNANSSFQQAEKLSPGSGLHVCTPSNAERKVSVLELQKIPDLAGGITGTKTVSEKFEEIDCFGNTYFTSKQSTFVSRQDQSGLSSTFTNQTITQNSPDLQRSEQAIFSDNLSKNKSKKFLSPAKEMCAACLTPVYPMEKMVADKLVLHNNCFCCKHCNKRLSLHNYSALYGDFYCLSHYQQLFRKNGNYDEGFGHKQHKDRWLAKAEEPDANNKFSASCKAQNTWADGPLISSTTSSTQGLRDANSENRNKLRISWPPENRETKPSFLHDSTSVFRRTFELSIRHNSSPVTFRNAVGKSRITVVDETDKSALFSRWVDEKTNTFCSTRTNTGDIKSERSDVISSASSRSSPKTKDAHTQCEISEICTNETKPRLDLYSFCLESERERNVHEGGKNYGASKIKKTVRFSSALKTKEEYAKDVAKPSGKPEVQRDMRILNADEENQESNERNQHITQDPHLHPPTETLLKTNPTFDKKHPSSTEAENCEILSKNNNSDLTIILKENVEKEASPNAAPYSNETQPKIAKVLDTAETIKCDGKSISKMNDKNGHDKLNRGSWSKGKSPLSLLFTSGSKGKDNKSEVKVDSKKMEGKPRNLLNRLFSSTETETDVKKKPEIKTEAKVQDDEPQENTNGEHMISTFVREKLCESPSYPNNLLTSQNVPEESPEEEDLPFQMREESEISTNADQAHPPKSLYGKSNTDLFLSSQNSTNQNLSSLESSKPPGLENDLTYSVSQKQNPTCVKSIDGIHSEVMSTHRLDFSDSDQIFPNRRTEIIDFEIPLLEMSVQEENFNQQDLFGEETLEDALNVNVVSRPSLNVTEENVDIFDLSESNEKTLANTLDEVQCFKVTSALSEQSLSEPTLGFLSEDNLSVCNNETQESDGKNQFQGNTDSETAFNVDFGLPSPDSDPINVSIGFDPKAPEIDNMPLLFQIDASEQTVSDKELIQSPQSEVFDWVNSKPDVSSLHPHITSSFINTDIHNTGSTANTGDLLDVFDSLASHSEIDESKDVFFQDDIFAASSSRPSEPEQTSDRLDATNTEKNTVLYEKAENNWMSGLFG